MILKYELILIVFCHLLIITQSIVHNTTIPEFGNINCFNNRCVCNQNRTVIVCSQFSSFHELVFESTTSPNPKILLLRLSPRKSLFLDGNFSLDALDFHQNASIEFENLDGLSLPTRIFNSRRNKNLHLRLMINNSKIFFHNSDEIKQEEIDNLQYPLFSFFSHITFGQGNSFLEAIPEIAFKNAHILNLQLWNLVYPENGFFIVHSFNSPLDLLNSEIYKLEFANCELVQLNTRIINQRVFAKLRELVVSSKVSSIQHNLFSHFKYISTVFLDLIDLEAFLTRSSNKWMEYLNNQRSRLYFFLTLGDRSSRYVFPDEHICYFRHFPINHHVMTFVRTKSRIGLLKYN